MTRLSSAFLLRRAYEHLTASAAAVALTALILMTVNAHAGNRTLDPERHRSRCRPSRSKCSTRTPLARGGGARLRPRTSGSKPERMPRSPFGFQDR